MQMSSRVRHSWNELGKRLVAIEPGAVASAFGEWIGSSLVHVATPAAEAIARARCIQRLVRTPVEELPTSQRAIDATVKFARGESPTDPIKAVELADRIAHSLTAYRLPSDCCPTCQGEVDVWTSLDEEPLLACNVLGCVWSLALERTTRLLGLAPASLQNVRVRYPDADLVPQRNARVASGSGLTRSCS
jgi:hypothetical protein